MNMLTWLRSSWKKPFSYYPFFLLFLGVATLIMLYGIWGGKEVLIEKPFRSSLFLALLFLFPPFLARKYPSHRLYIYAAALVVGILSIAFIFSLSFDEELYRSFWSEWQYDVLLSLPVILWLSGVGVGKLFNAKDFIRWVYLNGVANLYASLLTIFILGSFFGLLWMIEHLFEVEISSKIYESFGALGIFLVGYFYTLQLPKEITGSTFTGLEKEKLYRWGTYALTVVATAYLVVFYAYILRIILFQEIPKGVLASMTLGLLFQWILVYLLWQPYNHQWLKKYNRFLWMILLPPVGVFFWALGLRVEAYGWTFARYTAFLAGLWVLLTIGYYLAYGVRAKFVRAFLLFIPLLLFGSLGPFSAKEMVWRSQTQHLKDLLQKVKENKTLTVEEATRLADITNYLWRHFPPQTLEKAFPGVFSHFSEEKYYLPPMEVCKAFEVKCDFSVSSKLKPFPPSFFDGGIPIPVKDFSFVTWVSKNYEPFLDAEGNVFPSLLNPSRTRLFWEGESDTLFFVREGTIIASVNLTALTTKHLSQLENQEKAKMPFTLTFEAPKVKAKIIFPYGSLQKTHFFPGGELMVLFQWKQ